MTAADQVEMKIAHQMPLSRQSSAPAKSQNKNQGAKICRYKPTRWRKAAALTPVKKKR